jgi:alpha-galactosidase
MEIGREKRRSSEEGLVGARLRELPVTSLSDAQPSIGSTTGYSSHLHNPFVALVEPTTTEFHGDAYGFSLVYTGSHLIEVEKGSQGYTRAFVGINPYHLSLPLAPGESFTTPEVVSIYSPAGLGGMSRQ